MKVTNPLVRRIVEQEHQPPDASEIQTLQLSKGKQLSKWEAGAGEELPADKS